MMKIKSKHPHHHHGWRVKSRLEKERAERVEPFMKGAQVRCSSSLCSNIFPARSWFLQISDHVFPPLFLIRHSCKCWSRSIQNMSSMSTLPWTMRVPWLLQGLLTKTNCTQKRQRLSDLTTEPLFQSSISFGMDLASSFQDRSHNQETSSSYVPSTFHNALTFLLIDSTPGRLFRRWPSLRQGCQGAGVYYLTATYLSLITAVISWNTTKNVDLWFYFRNDQPNVS